VLPHQ
jgi:hypothetical protein